MKVNPAYISSTGLAIVAVTASAAAWAWRGLNDLPTIAEAKLKDSVNA